MADTNEEYRILSNLIIENGGFIKKISYREDSNDVITVYATGEENHLKFAQYLFDRHKSRVRTMKAGIHIDDYE